MKTAVILLVAVIVCGSTFAVQYLRLQKAEAMCSALKTDLKEWQEAADRWQLLAEQSQKGEAALEAQAQSCLDREAAARADADAWKSLLDEATLRAMTPKEEKGVPDTAMRRALSDALDRPL